LSSDNVSVASVPASVTVPAGATGATFAVSTVAVSAATPVTISAGYGGSSRLAILTVNRPSLLNLSLTPLAVAGGTPSTGTVMLSGPAAAG
jgi:hypothetical protein